MPSLRQNLVVQFPSLQPMFSGGMLRKDDHERIAFVGHQYTAWAIVFPLFFSDLSSALVHKAAWEFGYRILCEKEELLLEGGQEDIEGQLETK